MFPTFPEVVTRFIKRATLVADEVGESPCPVYSFTQGDDQFFLKISPSIYASTTFSVLREARVLEWVGSYLNVPDLLLVAESHEAEFMITRRVPGEPLYQRIDTQQPVVSLFQEALRQLRAVPADSCPFDSGTAFRLQELAYLIRNGLHAEKYDLGQWPGLHTPQDLLAYLQATKPAEELTFAHGDLGDSNVFVTAADELYYIDLGRAGLADRWMDVAFIHRNLREEVSEAVAADFLNTLGETDKPDKRAFFEQLDELF